MEFFRFSLQFNDSYAFRDQAASRLVPRLHGGILPDFSGESHAHVRRCEQCGQLVAKWEASLDGLVIRNRRYDISLTFDGVWVVSRRFKEVYDSQSLKGLDFSILPDDTDFYNIRATRSVAFDAKRRDTAFRERCAVCRQFKSVVGATPIFLQSPAYIGDSEFVRTDLEFGTDDEKCPLLLCGKTVAQSFEEVPLVGVTLMP